MIQKFQQADIKRLNIVLIKPSKYDDDGYVIRHWRGVLPSNTLACLYSLTEDLKRRRVLGPELKIETTILDETVKKTPVERIIRSNCPPDCLTVVGLVGVQSNQYPRAVDLARRFRAGGVPVLIGGFHVSGSLALFPDNCQEIQELIDIGVSVVAGEVEETWQEVLKDVLNNDLKPLYDFLECKPDLQNQPVPRFPGGYLKSFVSSKLGTIDCSRGCPFNCSFCSIINVQGRKMRFRSAAALENAIRENFRRHGIGFYFFTDDNFARNAAWRDIFEMMIRLREEEHLPLRFMMQVDALSYKIPDFIHLASQAGCTQVFIGMESINPENLKASGKGQNHVSDYRRLIAAWHEARIATHVAYIIGFPFDTPESVREDIARLKSELKVEQASFFMLTPIPGSRDHERMVREGVPIDPDLNKYDSFHETMPHPNFRPGEWLQTYKDTWREFYSFEYMRDVLLNANPENYWNIFQNFLWYKNAALIEEGHPMIHGFFRLKDRTDRRKGFPVESRLRHFRRRAGEIRRMARAWLTLILEMEELWLQTRKRSEAEQRLLEELKRMRREVNRGLRSAELHVAHIRAGIHVPELRVPSRLALKFRYLDFRIAKRITYSRSDLQQFWRKCSTRWGGGRYLLTHPHKVALHLLRDAQLLMLFAAAFLRAGDFSSRAHQFKMS